MSNDASKDLNWMVTELQMRIPAQWLGHLHEHGGLESLVVKYRDKVKASTDGNPPVRDTSRYVTSRIKDDLYEMYQRQELDVPEGPMRDLINSYDDEKAQAADALQYIIKVDCMRRGR